MITIHVMSLIVGIVLGFVLTIVFVFFADDRGRGKEE